MLNREREMNMHIFRIRVSRRHAAPVRFTGLFADSVEALRQVLAD